MHLVISHWTVIDTWVRKVLLG